MKEYRQSLLNQSINHSITWEWADFETFPRTCLQRLSVDHNTTFILTLIFRNEARELGFCDFPWLFLVTFRSQKSLTGGGGLLPESSSRKCATVKIHVKKSACHAFCFSLVDFSDSLQIPPSGIRWPRWSCKSRDFYPLLAHFYESRGHLFISVALVLWSVNKTTEVSDGKKMDKCLKCDVKTFSAIMCLSIATAVSCSVELIIQGQCYATVAGAPWVVTVSINLIAPPSSSNTVHKAPTPDRGMLNTRLTLPW